MVPKLHAKGSSFKGLADYLLHDKGKAKTSERVDWTDTRNLATKDPDLAWRIMAATAMDQHRLKTEAGVSMAGRKSDKHVLHLTLSWHPDQAPDQAEIRRAGNDAIAALGANDRQALFVVHNDEDHVHLHIAINRVSPTDGRHLSSSKEKLKLSQWAETYEKETGIYCKNRIANNAERKRKMSKPKRDRGAFVRSKKDEARHIHEAFDVDASNDNDKFYALKAAQKAQDHALALRGRNLAKQQKAAWKSLSAAHKARQDVIDRQLQKHIHAADKAAFDLYRPRKIALDERQAHEQQTFEAMEKSVFGRMGNVIKVAHLTAQILHEDKTGIIKRTFNIAHDAERRKAFFLEAQKRARDTLDRQQDEHASAASQPHTEAHRAKVSVLQQQSIGERDELVTHQNAQRQALQIKWLKRGKERKHAIAEFKRKIEERNQRQNSLDTANALIATQMAAKAQQEALKPIYDQAASPALPADQESKGERPTPSDEVLSDVELHRQSLKQKRGVDAFRKAMQGPTKEQDNDRER